MRPSKKKKHAEASKASLAAQQPSAANAQPPVVASPPAAVQPTAAQPPAAAQPVIVSDKLIAAGAACTRRVEAEAAASLVGTKRFTPVSDWQQAQPDKHMVDVVVGQNYGEDARAPYGVTGIVAAPNAASQHCEGFVFRVLPSPISCKEIEAGVLKGGKALGNLSGLSLLRDDNGQVVLIPAASGGGCTVVAFHTDY